MDKDGFTISEHYLDVGDGHKLYVQDWGNKNAKPPIIFLHGGPGAGVNDKHKQQFDPAQQRVIFFDQRGAGKSLPKGLLKHNTTQDLVEDIERIVKHLKLDKFIIAGGSWGSCLAFAYALKHPDCVHALVLRGIFTGSQEEIDYLDHGGFRTFFPDVWDAYLKRTPKSDHSDPSAYHYRQAGSSDAVKMKESAYAYAELEVSLLSLDDRHTPKNFEEFEPESTLIEMHYLTNRCFMPDRHILSNAHKLTMPIWLVQGRYDAICPPITTYKLHQKLPNSQLIWTTAGHVGSERSIYDVMKALLLQLTA